MYNSVLVSFCHLLAVKFSKLYKTSCIHKISSSLRKNHERYKETSLVYKIFRNLRRVFESSFIYKLSLGILKATDRFFKVLFTKKSRLTSGSDIANSLDLYSLDLRYGLRLFYESLVFLSLFFILGKIFFHGPSLKVSLLLLALGLFGIAISGKEFQIIKTSKTLNFFLDIFRLDQGGESWW